MGDNRECGAKEATAGKLKKAGQLSAQHGTGTHTEQESLDNKILPVNFALCNEEAGDDQDERPTEHRDAEDPSVEKSTLWTVENERGTRGKTYSQEALQIV